VKRGVSENAKGEEESPKRQQVKKNASLTWRKKKPLTEKWGLIWRERSAQPRRGKRRRHGDVRNPSGHQGNPPERESIGGGRETLDLIATTPSRGKGNQKLPLEYKKSS